MVISELNTWPVCSPVNASPVALRPPAHDSGPKWCATPFLCGSLIRYSMPVYPGAFPDPFLFPPIALLSEKLFDLLHNLGRLVDNLFHDRFLFVAR